jgi:hypothetical protein
VVEEASSRHSLVSTNSGSEGDRSSRTSASFADHSLDAIGVRTLGGGDVELADRTGKSWIGTPEAALAALDGMEPTGKPVDAWARLRRA